jgi:hypothetical protein
MRSSGYGRETGVESSGTESAKNSVWDDIFAFGLTAEQSPKA